MATMWKSWYIIGWNKKGEKISWVHGMLPNFHLVFLRQAYANVLGDLERISSITLQVCDTKD